MKLKIRNSTHWSTGDLRRITLRCMHHLGIDPDKQHTMDVEYRRSYNRTSGWAYVGTGHFCLRLPRALHQTKDTGQWIVRYQGGAPWDSKVVVPDAFPPEIVTDITRTLLHELQHTMGLRHEDMADCWAPEYLADCPWHKNYQVRRLGANKKAASPVDKREATARNNLRLAEERVKKLAQQTKRANTILKKWRAKVRYYDKRKDQT